MGPYAGDEYNLTLCPLQSRLQHIYHGQPYARVDLNPAPESTLSPSQGLRIWPLHATSTLDAFLDCDTTNVVFAHNVNKVAHGLPI
jgi:hypothetical protein